MRLFDLQDDFIALELMSGPYISSSDIDNMQILSDLTKYTGAIGNRPVTESVLSYEPKTVLGEMAQAAMLDGVVTVEVRAENGEWPDKLNCSKFKYTCIESEPRLLASLSSLSIASPYSPSVAIVTHENEIVALLKHHKPFGLALKSFPDVPEGMFFVPQMPVNLSKLRVTTAVAIDLESLGVCTPLRFSHFSVDRSEKKTYEAQPDDITLRDTDLFTLSLSAARLHKNAAKVDADSIRYVL